LPSRRKNCRSQKKEREENTSQPVPKREGRRGKNNYGCLHPVGRKKKTKKVMQTRGGRKGGKTKRVFRALRGAFWGKGEGGRNQLKRESGKKEKRGQEKERSFHRIARSRYIEEKKRKEKKKWAEALRRKGEKGSKEGEES